MGQVANFGLGVVGGVVGFLVSGGNPLGAAVGFSLGFGIGGLINSPDVPEQPRPEDDLQITSATEGTTVALVFGRRRVNGNIIWYGDVRVEEITEELGKGLGGGESVVGTKVYLPVEITLCVDTLVTLHSVVSGREEDWVQRNSDEGGAPLQISTGAGTDFGYSTLAMRRPGVTSVFSPDLFIGENTRSFTPLKFEVEVHPTTLFGAPTSGLTTGVNAASVIWTLLTNNQYGRAIPTDFLDGTSFQDAYDRIVTDDMGIDLLEERGGNLKSIIEQILFHVNGILRQGPDGRLQLFLLRYDNFTAAPVPENLIADIQVTNQTFAEVDNNFIATYPDREQGYTQRTVDHRNSAVIEKTGRRKTRTYNFRYFCERDLASRRLFEIMEDQSFPSPVVAIKVSNKFHNVLKGDVIALTHRAYGFEGKLFRVLDIRAPDLGKLGFTIKARAIREPILVNYVPPTPDPEPELPVVEPQVPVDVGGIGHPWNHPKKPPTGGGFGPTPAPGPGPGPGPNPPGIPPTIGIPVPTGPFPSGTEDSYVKPIKHLGTDDETLGYPMHFFVARGAGRDAGALVKTVVDDLADLPTNERGLTAISRFAFSFRTLDAIPAQRYYPRSVPTPGTPGDPPSDDLARPGKVLRLQFRGYPGQSFGLATNEATDDNGFQWDLENNRYAMVVGGTEIWLWTTYRDLGNNVYEFQGLHRGNNKEYLYAWPVGTPVFIADLRAINRPEFISYMDWGHRNKLVADTDYAAGVRLRGFFHSVDFVGAILPVEDGIGGSDGITFTDRAGAKETVSNFYLPENEILSFRAPFPHCQGYLKLFPDMDGVGERRSWYAEAAGLGGTADFVVEFPPFPNDEEVAGQAISYDTTGATSGPPMQPYNGFLHLPTDRAFDEFIAGSTGDEYLLIVMDDITQDPVSGTPRRTITATIPASGNWPALIYSSAQISSDATAAGTTFLDFVNKAALYVTIKGVQDELARPRLVQKLGPWSPQRDPRYEISPS